MEVRSRDASAPELCQRRSQNRPAEQDRVTPQAAVGPAFGSIMPNKQKGSGTPAGALVQSSAPYGRGSREASRARLSAFHHGTCCSDRTPQLSSSTRFLGLRRHQVLPASDLSQSSELPRRPVIVPAGRMTRSRPGAEVTSPRPREPLPLRQPVSPAGVLSVSEIRGL